MTLGELADLPCERSRKTRRRSLERRWKLVGAAPKRRLVNGYVTVNFIVGDCGDVTWTIPMYTDAISPYPGNRAESFTSLHREPHHLPASLLSIDRCLSRRSNVSVKRRLLVHSRPEYPVWNNMISTADQLVDLFTRDECRRRRLDFARKQDSEVR